MKNRTFGLALAGVVVSALFVLAWNQAFGGSKSDAGQNIDDKHGVAERKSEGRRGCGGCGGSQTGQAKAQGKAPGMGHAAKAHQKTGCGRFSGGAKSCKKSCVLRLDAILKDVQAAEKAVRSDHKKVALTHLAKAREGIAHARKAMGPAAAIANARCPIMGSKIDASKVPAKLTRMYKGSKVAFCCGGCPAAWDALTDAEKQAKLKAAGLRQAVGHRPVARH